MEFHGSITFDIADEKDIDVDFGVDIIPTKTVKKGDIVALGRKTPKNRWMYKLELNKIAARWLPRFLEQFFAF